MATKSKGKMKSLGSMRDKTKGKIHHLEIHPATTGDGGQGFTTKVFRSRTPAQEKAYSTGKGPYTPEVSEDEGAQRIHEDGVDMIDHVKQHLGVQDEEPDEDEDDGSAGEGAY
jgi:hypothetical protein